MDNTKDKPGQTVGTVAPDNTVLGHTYYEVYGSSYKFNKDGLSRPFSVTTLTGYATPSFCTAATSTKCDFVVNPAVPPATFNTKNYKPGGTYSHAAGTVFGTLLLSQFARYAQTRTFTDFLKDYSEAPATYFFHKGGFNEGYLDGHVKYVTSKTYETMQGCDGIDWAYDTPGSCNGYGLQRQAQ